MSGGTLGYEAQPRARVAPAYAAPRLRNLNRISPAGPLPTSLQASTGETAAPEECDRALVQRIAVGDTSALGLLYDRWAECIHAVAFRILRDTHDAEDVVEDVFWQAWRTADRYASARGSVRTWLMLMARTRAIDRLRNRSRACESLIDDLPDGAPSHSWIDAESPLSQAEQSEYRASLFDALCELPGEQRQVLEMAYFEGLSQSEIARRTGEPLGTVKTRVRLAMRKLRTRLSIFREAHA